MRSKPVAVILAFTLGILGAHRLYLGQYLRAILYLVYPVALATLFFYFSGTLHIVREQLHFERSFEALYFLLPFLLVPIFDAIWLGIMSRAKFFDRYNATIGNTWGRLWRSMVALVAGAGIALGLYQMFFVVKPIDMTREADFKLSAEELVAAFAGNADSAIQRFNGLIIEVQGTVVDEEWGIATGGDLRALLLEGKGATLVKCRFPKAQQDAIKDIGIGETVAVKGILEDASDFEVILKECVLVE